MQDNFLLYNKLKKMKNKTILLKSFLLIFILAIGILVYFTGGTKNSYAHLIYLPIVISGYFYGLKGGDNCSGYQRFCAWAFNAY